MSAVYHNGYNKALNALCGFEVYRCDIVMEGQGKTYLLCLDSHLAKSRTIEYEAYEKVGKLMGHIGKVVGRDFRELL